MADAPINIGGFGLLSLPLIIVAVVIIAIMFGLGLIFFALFLWVLQSFLPILLILVGIFLLYRNRVAVGLVLTSVGIALWLISNYL